MENNSNNVRDCIARLSRVMRRGGREGHGHGLNRVLAALMEEDGLRASDLSERLDIRPPSLTEALKRMEHHGHITRVKDEEDSRASLIYLTDKAREEFAQSSSRQNEFEDKIRQCLTEEEITSFCAISDKLSEFFEKELPGENDCKRGERRREGCGHHRPDGHREGRGHHNPEGRPEGRGHHNGEGRHGGRGPHNGEGRPEGHGHHNGEGRPEGRGHHRPEGRHGGRGRRGEI